MKTNYVLVTPAHNEEGFIEKTIVSVVNQTSHPLKWVIISDRSTDSTDKIIKKYASQYPFIKYLRKDTGNKRDIASKVHAINMGLSYLKEKKYEYDFIGNLDADVSFKPDYFEELIKIFRKNNSFGIIGGRIYHEIKGQLIEYTASEESIAGAVQFFRKECFEQIGGYLPLPGGFEDSVAELSARYHGWQTKSIKGLIVIHNREIGTVSRSIWAARFNNGVNEYIFGYNFIYHLLRLCYYINRKPIFLGSVVGLLGYLYAMITRREKIIPKHLIEFQKLEQKARISGRFKKLIGIEN